jgi:diguanylate cyclase (GGDEF)-like protein
MRLASFPELAPYPIIEMSFNQEITYLNLAAIQQFPELQTEKNEHPLLRGIIDLPNIEHENYLLKEVKIGNRFFQEAIYILHDTELIRFYVLDVTHERHLAEKTRTILNNIPECILHLNRAGEIIDCNFGGNIFRRSDTVIGTSIYDFFDYKLARRILKVFEFEANSDYGFEEEILKDEDSLHYEFRPVRLNDNECIVLIQDITKRKQYEKHILHDALHDPLTGLANRKLFNDRLSHRLDSFKRYQDADAAVLFLDLDRFKAVNDTLGHDIGDELLKRVAARLNAHLRNSDTLCRWGGDEFVILLHSFRSREDVEHLADRLIEALEKPFIINEHHIQISASIGMAVGLSHYTTAADLIRDADTAMYHAKVAGKAQAKLFELSMGTDKLMDSRSDQNQAQNANPLQG